MRNDPLSALPVDLVGRRVSLRVALPGGPAGRMGLVLAVTPTTLTMEHRTGTVQTVERASIQYARVIPTVPRGRNPRHAPADQLTALANGPGLDAFPGRYWIARLCDLVDHLDDSDVHPLASTTAARGDSRGLVNGEWSAMRLAARSDLAPLAAWAARRNARNVVLTSGLSDETLVSLGLDPLTD